VKKFKSVLVIGAAVAGLTSLSACATKEYVDKEVLRVDTYAQSSHQELSSNMQQGFAATDQKIAAVDGTAREALERATAAGKLAEGKFLYQMVLSDDGVKFPTDSSKLSPEAESRLMQLADRLKSENRNVFLEIQGHTDASGAPAYNERLGEQRAQAVRNFLAKNGVALSRMDTISYGEDAPVAPNDNREGRAQNRRVVVVVLS
jgi:outer membrane protein OmpA-like peptidoglycan-associated protein